MCFWKSKKKEENMIEQIKNLTEKIVALEKIVRQNIDTKSSAINEEECAKTIWAALEAIANDVKILEDGGQDATYSKDDVLSILARDRKKFEGLLTDYIPDQEDMSNPYKVEEIDSDKDVAPGTEVIPGKRFGDYIIYRAKKIKERA